MNAAQVVLGELVVWVHPGEVFGGDDASAFDVRESCLAYCHALAAALYERYQPLRARVEMVDDRADAGTSVDLDVDDDGVDSEHVAREVNRIRARVHATADWRRRAATEVTA